MEIQKSIGALGADIAHLRAESKAHGDKLARFEKILYAGSIIGSIALGIALFLVNKLWDPVVSALIEYAKTRP